MPETIYLNEKGILVTESKVRAHGRTYPLSGNLSLKTHSSEELGAHREKTSRLRRGVLSWGLLAALAVSAWAGINYADAVREYYYVADERIMGEREAQGIASALAFGLSIVALLGVALCVRVNRPQIVYYVSMLADGNETPIASSNDEARIRAIAAAVEKAIAQRRQMA